MGEAGGSALSMGTRLFRGFREGGTSRRDVPQDRDIFNPEPRKFCAVRTGPGSAAKAEPVCGPFRHGLKPCPDTDRQNLLAVSSRFGSCER